MSWIKRTGLHIKENAEFYVALAKNNHSSHNFLTLGFIDPDTGLGYQLASVAFRLNRENLSYFNQFKGGGFQRDKGIAYVDQPAYTYKAYTMTRAEYLKFVSEIRSFSGIRKADNFKAYYPSPSNQNWFEYQVVPKILDDNPDRCVNSHFSLRNTCRQVAQTAARSFLGIEDWGRNVHRKFFMPLPCRAKAEKIETIVNGETTICFRSKDPLFVFPREPKVGEEFFKQRRRIMRRMESIAKENSDLSRKKFAAWKELYLKLSPAQTERNSYDLLADINNWMNDHKELMTLHRNKHRHHLFSTQSEKLVHQLEEDFQLPTLSSFN